VQRNFRLDQQGVEVRRFSRKTTIIAASMALVIATSVVAFAFWTNAGAGEGTASTGDTPDNLVINQTSTVEDLVPGGPPGELSGHFDNPNPSGVFVHEVTATVSSVDGGSGPTPPCTPADFAVGPPDTVNAEIPSGSAQGSWGPITPQLLDTASNQDNCKNAIVHISYSSN
jgi:hypothetical protein